MKPGGSLKTISTKEHRHGEESKEGCQSDEGQGCSEGEEGPLAVTLTLNQCTERAGRLSGELKAARELRSICADDLVAKEREATLARQALENAEANITRLETERAELAEEAKLAILAKGEPLEIEADPTYVGNQQAGDDGISVENAFASPLYENGVTRLNAVFDEATHP